MSDIKVKTPWKPFIGEIPFNLNYFQGTIYQAVKRIAEQYPNYIAFDFMGSSTTYKKMLEEINAEKTPSKSAPGTMVHYLIRTLKPYL